MPTWPMLSSAHFFNTEDYMLVLFMIYWIPSLYVLLELLMITRHFSMTIAASESDTFLIN